MACTSVFKLSLSNGFGADAGRSGAPTSTGGPETHGAFEALWECVGLGGPEIPVAEGCTPLPKGRSTVTTWSSERSGGGRKAGGGMY